MKVENKNWKVDVSFFFLVTLIELCFLLLKHVFEVLLIVEIPIYIHSPLGLWSSGIKVCRKGVHVVDSLSSMVDKGLDLERLEGV